jgi:hypothetical protein
LRRARNIHTPSFIQVQRKGNSRLPSPGEALSMVIGALGTLTRTSGVKGVNAEINGQPVAVAIIEGAQFGEDNNGNTVLDELESEHERAI